MKHLSPTRNHSLLLSLGCWAGVLHAILAVDPSPTADKSQYNLFNPTPRELLREMNTDRPDKTEGAYTLDAGHFQLEMDAVVFSRDLNHGSKTDEWNYASMNLKAGLLNHVDLQVIVPLHNVVRTMSPGMRISESGFGDVKTRLKVNFWGNDGGSTAFAVMPYAKWPTASAGLAANRSVEGGLINALAVQLPTGFELGMMSECDFIRNDTTAGYHAEFVNSVTVSHVLRGELAGYLEFWSEVGTDGAPWQGSVDLGLTYGVTPNFQLDLGINLGITRSAPDFQPFLGISWRF